MALTIKMRIDEQPEHSYVFTTGDGGEIELIPLSVVANGSYTAPDGKAYNIVTVNVPETELDSLNITENGTYNAPDGTAYNVVTVNVEPILEAVTRSYTENGTYTIVPSEQYDGISSVTVEVDVPTPEPNLQSKSVLYTLNDIYTVQPDAGYDGLSEVEVEVDVPSSGGDNDLFHEVITVGSSGANYVSVPVPSGKSVVGVCLVAYNDGTADTYANIGSGGGRGIVVACGIFLDHITNNWIKTGAYKGNTGSSSLTGFCYRSSMITPPSNVTARSLTYANGYVGFYGLAIDNTTSNIYGFAVGQKYDLFVMFD